MDALTLLKNDHKTVEALFKKFERLGEGGERAKKQIVSQIIKELAVHAAIEEQVFYPAVRKAVKQAEDMVLESLEEHHVVKWTLSELESLTPKDERYDAKVTVLMESIRHHVKEEETELFPMVSKKLDKRALEALGKALENAKKLAPTHPHPRAPDTPPANVVAGLGAGMLDKAKDFVQGVARRGLASRAKTAAKNGANATARRAKALTPRGTRGRTTSPSARAH
jgi:hemerythrin superfamily protein